MTSDRRLPVAIVGGGFSGTMVAAHLARRGVISLLIEGGGRAGLGTAYSTRQPAHVLNVRAGNMSAWPDDPDDFARFFEQSGGDAHGFAERRLFGRYLQQILAAALESGRVTIIEERAVAARPTDGGWSVELASGEELQAAAVVLALGNLPPQPLPIGKGLDGRFVADPWGEDARAAIEHAATDDSDVLILGTGLTMVDMVLSLDAAGHCGRITAVSRRGLVPRAHADFTPAPAEIGELPTAGVRGLWRWLRRRGAQVGWRAAVDSLRPHSHALWQALDVHQQKRFLRHARPWWDVHRHRIAPEVARKIHEMVAEGRLEVIAGRALGMIASDDGLEVRIARRSGRGEALLSVGFAFNCTGPLGTLSGNEHPILRQMLEEKLVCPDALGIGIDVDERSRATGPENLWALGPLTKGTFWEIIAVPDIRVQAAQVADDIAREVCR